MICAIVLAAGESRRMGAKKLLLPFGSTTVIGHIVDQLLGSVVDQVIVAVGHEVDRIIQELADRPVEIVTNPDYKTGMLSSVRCGLRVLPQQAEAVMIALGDQPAITSELVDETVRAFRSTDKGILVPVYAGRRGHPLLFAKHYRDEILTSFDDVGLRGLLHAHPADVFELNASTSAVLSDMDRPEDYRREIDSLEEDAE
jgi:molybdenum cofactor cytidylyltransferase